jgi:mRNA interferase RelE/StbE
MSYKLKFLPSARKEWDRLDASLKVHFKKRLSQRLLNPHVPSAKLRGFKNHYKIKLRASGYRLVYEVLEGEKPAVLVITIAKREKAKVYKLAEKRKRQ